jgi:hypothetical protein
MPRPSRWSWSFVGTNALVWALMVVILVLVPDTLARWMSIEIARFVGWAFACGVWVLVVERQWQERFPPFTRFVLQVMLWVAAAATAIWISEAAQSPITR